MKHMTIHDNYMERVERENKQNKEEYREHTHCFEATVHSV